MFQDDPTEVVIGWLVNDPDHFNFAAESVTTWTDEGTDLDDVLSDLASYVHETLSYANPYSRAGKCQNTLSDADLTSINWQAVLDRLLDN